MNTLTLFCMIKESYVALNYNMCSSSSLESQLLNQLFKCPVAWTSSTPGWVVKFYGIKFSKYQGFYFIFEPFEQVVDDDRDENATMVPVIYEDRDESDDEKSEDAMETDLDSTDEEASEAFDGVSDIDEVMAWVIDVNLRVVRVVLENFVPNMHLYCS